MNLNGYMMTEGNVTSIKTRTKNDGDIFILSIGILNLKNAHGQTEVDFTYKIPRNNFSFVLTKICDLFNIDKLDDLKNKPIYTLSSYFNTLLIMPKHKFELFSFVSEFESSQSWVRETLQDPLIAQSNFNEKEKINFAILKKCLDNNSKKTILDTNIYKSLELTLLKNKLENNLNHSSKINKISKI